MGIFNNKPQTDSAQQDSTTTDTTAAVSPVATVDSSTQVTDASSGLNQTAPTLDEAVQEDTGGYITTDPPASTLPDTSANQDAYGSGSGFGGSSEQTDAPVPVDPVSNSFTPAYPSEETTEQAAPDQVEAAPAPSPDVTNTGVTTDNDDLTAIKEEALKQLSPLVQHLDQSPEEKFHTTMMMLQSTDNPSLVKTAYEAAQAIADDKTRAQALLDIVNEINYFNQQKN